MVNLDDLRDDFCCDCGLFVDFGSRYDYCGSPAYTHCWDCKRGTDPDASDCKRHGEWLDLVEEETRFDEDSIFERSVFPDEEEALNDALSDLIYEELGGEKAGLLSVDELRAMARERVAAAS